jgi:hypothetical protein
MQHDLERLSMNAITRPSDEHLFSECYDAGEGGTLDPEGSAGGGEGPDSAGADDAGVVGD